MMLDGCRLPVHHAQALGADLVDPPPEAKLAGRNPTQRLGLRTVLWSAWGKDWTPEATAGSVLDELEPDLGPGVTVLLHDSDCASAPGSSVR